MTDYCDRIDANARTAAELADSGQNLNALYKMQDDIRDSRTPLQAIQYASEVKGMLATRGSQAHVNMCENERTGAVDVTLEIPALSADGRQYVDQLGRPMLIKQQVAHIETRSPIPDRVIVLPPRIDVPPPPCYEERAWLRLDEHRGKVRFDLNIGGVRIDIGTGGGDRHHGPPIFDPRRWYPGRPDYRGGHDDHHHDDRRDRDRDNDRDNRGGRGGGDIIIINKNTVNTTEKTAPPRGGNDRHDSKGHDEKRKR